MAIYQGTTYDPSRLLPYVEEARRRRASEAQERQMLDLQMQMMQEDIADRQYARKIAKENRRAQKKESESQKRAAQDLRQQIETAERERAGSRGSSEAGGNAKELANALKERYNALTGQKIYDKFVPNWGSMATGGGGGGRMVEETATPQMSKDAMIGLEIDREMRQQSAAEELAKMQAAQEETAAQDKFERDMAKIKSEQKFTAEENKKNREMKEEIAQSGAITVNDVQSEIANISDPEERAIAMQYLEKFQNNPQALKELYVRLYRTKAGEIAKMETGTEQPQTSARYKR